MANSLVEGAAPPVILVTAAAALAARAVYPALTVTTVSRAMNAVASPLCLMGPIQAASTSCTPRAFTARRSSPRQPAGDCDASSLRCLNVAYVILPNTSDLDAGWHAVADMRRATGYARGASARRSGW
jgi:hypothetical protein